MPNLPSAFGVRGTTAAGLCLATLCSLAGCADRGPTLPHWTVEAVDNPARGGAMAPSLRSGPEGVWLSWLAPEETDLETPSPTSPMWALNTAPFGPDGFHDADVAARSGAMFANWADFPTTVGAPSGAQYTHHLAKLGSPTFAYGVFLQGRDRADAPWIDLGLLHDDASETEHGFVSYATHGEKVRAFWLDGRGMLAGGPMTLRTVLLPETGSLLEGIADSSAGTSGAPGSTESALRTGPSSELLDDRVCECCQTDAATTSDGPIVVFRDRSLDEIRDIYIVRFEDGEWSEPTAVHHDGWEIAGCPVNGPAVVASGDFVAVAWFTAADDEPRTRLAVSEDGGRTFSRPTDLAGGRGAGRAIGRIDLAIHSRPTESPTGPETSHDLWVAHLAQPAESSDEPAGPALVVDHLRFDARLRRGGQTVIASTSEARSSGLPRMAVVDGAPLIAWVDGGQTSRVRTARLVESVEAVEATGGR